MSPLTKGSSQQVALILVFTMAALACSPAPSPNASPNANPTAPAATPPPTATPTPAPIAGIDWGEPVRLPGSHTRAGAASAVSYMGRIVVVATVATAEGFSIGVWTSADGVEWSFEMPESLTSSRATGLIVGPKGLVLAGSRVEPGAGVVGPGTAVRAALWTSDDARTWTDVAAGPEFGADLINDLATDGTGILAIGSKPIATPTDEACPTATIWRSTDGTTWDTVPPPETCARPFSVAGHDGRFVVLGAVPDPNSAGMPGATKPVAWLVEGDAPWKRLDDVPPAGAMYALVDGPPGFLLVPGSPTVADTTPASVLTSTDGKTWTTVAEGDDFGRGPGGWAPLVALGFADTFYLSWVRRSGEGLMETALFRSHEGSAWSPVPPSAALDRSPTLTSVVLHEGTIVGIGGRAQILAWVSPPSASGPEPPTFAKVQVVETSIPGDGVPRAVAFDGDTALALGSWADPASGTIRTTTWNWSAAAGWATVETTGLDGAEISGLASGPGGWVAVGSIRGPRVPGDPSQGTQIVAHAWTSADGRRWTAHAIRLDESGPTTDRLMSITPGGPGYVAIGISYDASCAVAGLTSLVLTSPDGAAWSPVDDPDLTCAQVTGVDARDGRLVAVGATNRLVVTPASSSTPCGMDVCLGGTARSQGRPAAWVSADGREWSPADALDLGWSTGFTSVAGGRDGYVAIWSGETLFASPDGLTWAPTFLPLGSSLVQASRVIGTEDGYLALGRTTTFGADGSAPVDRFSLYFAADGRTWREIDPAAWSLGPGTYVSAMAGADGSGFLLVGTRQGQQPANLSWSVTLPGS